MTDKKDMGLRFELPHEGFAPALWVDTRSAYTVFKAETKLKSNYMDWKHRLFKRYDISEIVISKRTEITIESEVTPDETRTVHRDALISISAFRKIAESEIKRTTAGAKVWQRLLADAGNAETLTTVDTAIIDRNDAVDIFKPATIEDYKAEARGKKSLASPQQKSLENMTLEDLEQIARIKKAIEETMGTLITPEGMAKMTLNIIKAETGLDFSEPIK